MDDRKDSDDPARAHAIGSEDPAPVMLPDHVGFPLMITRRQRAALAKLGVSDADIRVMTPAEAHARLGWGAVSR